MAPRYIGQYQLLELLGHGRTAEVHCARYKRSKERVAIKLLHEFMTDQQIKQKFMTEATIVRKLDHPGIIRVFEAGFYQQTRPYIVMSYAPGKTLRERHTSSVPLPSEIILSYTRQLADALAYAHQRNIVHCDVKPENLLLGKDDRLILGDFGIARIRETTLSQTTHDAFGTATYMAPEQFRGKYSPYTDQYALAIMVYEWLCGHPPFSGENQNHLMDRHMNMPVPSLREACEACAGETSISEEVEQVILKALAKESHLRFSDIQQFAQALEQAFLCSKSKQTTLAPEPIIVQKPDIGILGSDKVRTTEATQSRPRSLGNRRSSSPKSVGELLKQARYSQGISQEEVASLIGVSEETISRWERGTILPSPSKRKAVAKVYGISTEDFDQASINFLLTPSKQDLLSQKLEHLADRVNSFDWDASIQLRSLGNTIKDHQAFYSDDYTKTWVTSDIYQRIDPDNIRERFRNQPPQVSSVLRMFKTLRIILFFMPFIVAITGISSAILAYQKLLVTQPGVPSRVSFLQLWINGFQGLLPYYATPRPLLLIIGFMISLIMMITFVISLISRGLEIKRESGADSLRNNVINALEEASKYIPSRR